MAEPEWRNVSEWLEAKLPECPLCHRGKRFKVKEKYGWMQIDYEISCSSCKSRWRLFRHLAETKTKYRPAAAIAYTWATKWVEDPWFILVSTKVTKAKPLRARMYRLGFWRHLKL